MPTRPPAAEQAATLPKLTDVEPYLRTAIGAAAMHALKDAGWLARELTAEERAALQQQSSAARLRRWRVGGRRIS